MKLVINKCFGGFGVSREAFLRLRKMSNEYALDEADIGEKWNDGSGVRSESLDSFLSQIPRDDKDLVRVVEEMGDKASAHFARLEVVEIPDGVEWEIDEYDGNERVAEKHRTWP